MYPRGRISKPYPNPQDPYTQALSRPAEDADFQAQLLELFADTFSKACSRFPKP